MESKLELLKSKKAKRIAIVALILIVLNQAIGWYFSSYPTGIVLVLFVLCLSSLLNYTILFKPNSFSLATPLSKQETKRLKIELGCFLLAIGSLCLLLVQQQT